MFFGFLFERTTLGFGQLPRHIAFQDWNIRPHSSRLLRYSVRNIEGTARLLIDLSGLGKAFPRLIFFERAR